MKMLIKSMTKENNLQSGTENQANRNDIDWM